MKINIYLYKLTRSRNVQKSFSQKFRAALSPRGVMWSIGITAEYTACLGIICARLEAYTFTRNLLSRYESFTPMIFDTFFFFFLLCTIDIHCTFNLAVRFEALFRIPTRVRRLYDDSTILWKRLTLKSYLRHFASLELDYCEYLFIYLYRYVIQVYTLAACNTIRNSGAISEKQLLCAPKRY